MQPDRDAILQRVFSFEKDINALSIETPPRESMMMASVQERRMLNRSNMRLLRLEWLNLMAFQHSSDLREKMALFWHGHFACETIFPGLAQRQLQVLRTYGLGKFRDLLIAISKDPAMLQYLNNQQNRKGHPNENYARELMELFTISRGNYSEQDVQEAARAFTGWSSNLAGEFVFRARQHDFGKKEFMGRSGNWDGTDIIDILLEQRATATFLASRIYRYFVHEDIKREYVAELADVMRRTDYDMAKVMYYLFTQDWFYDPSVVGQRIKSPVELLAGMMRTAHAKPSSKESLHKLFAGMGQLLFRPPSVAGWPGGRQWINSGTLPIRMNLPIVTLDTKGTLARRLGDGSMRFDVPLRKVEKQYGSLLLQELSDHIMNVPMDVAKVPAHIATDTLARLRLLMAVPEYQMC